MVQFIPLSEAKRENFSAPKEPVEKTYKNEKTSGTYSRTYVQYKYTDPETKLDTISQAMFEVPGEVLINKDDSGKIVTTVRLTDPADVKGINEADAGVLNCIAQQRIALKMPNFKADNPPDGMRRVYFRSTNQKTGEPIEGTPPMVYLHTDKSSEFKYLTVRDENGKKVFDVKKVENPETLVGKILTGSIVFAIRDIYRAGNGTIYVQSYIRTITFMSIRESSTVDVMASSIVNKMMNDIEKNPGLLVALQQQLQNCTSLLVPANGGGTGAPAAPAAPAVQAPNGYSIPTSIPTSSSSGATNSGMGAAPAVQMMSQGPPMTPMSVPTMSSQVPQMQIPGMPTQAAAMQVPTMQIPTQMQAAAMQVPTQQLNIPGMPTQIPTQYSSTNTIPNPSQEQQLNMYLNPGPTITQIPQLNIKNL